MVYFIPFKKAAVYFERLFI